MTALVQALHDRNAAAIGDLLAGETRFHSPVRTYRDRGDVIHLLATIGSLFEDLRPIREWTGADGAVTFVSVRVGDRELDGVIEEIHDADGKVVELTLMLRPLGALLRAVERMGQALEASPLPSGASLGGPASPSPAGRASPRSGTG